MTLTDLYMVRHGLGENQIQHRHGIKPQEGGRYHTHSFRLDPRGFPVLRSIGKWLRNTAEFGPDDYLAASEYVRSLESAMLFGIKGARWRIEPFLVERNWGRLEQCTQEERRTLFGHDLEVENIQPFFWHPEGGESILGVLSRFMHVLLGAEAGGHERALFVTHRDVMWSARLYLEHLTQHEFRDMYKSSDNDDRILNGDILHYTRRHPRTGHVRSEFTHRRRIRCTTGPPVVSDWCKIRNTVFSNRELREIVKQYPRMYP